MLVVYALLAPTTIVDGDNAEFATLGALGGRAHPSGYPAYVLYLRATAWLPGASPAHTAALATCLLGALTVLALHAACRAWGARPLAATLACGIYAAAPMILRIHIEAEVFAGNALVVATVLWLAAAKGPAHGAVRAGLLGLVAGLGLANHVTCALVAPVGLLGVVRAVREGRVIALVAAIAGLAVGLSAYLYLVVADGPAAYGRVEGLGDVLAFATRKDFGGPTAFAASGDLDPLAQLGAFARAVGRAWLWLPALAGVALLGVRCVRPRHESRWAFALLAASFLIAGPVLVLRFNVDVDAPLGHYIVERFHLLPILLLAIPVALAIDLAIGDRVTKPRLASVLAIGVFLGLVGVALPRLRAVHSPAVEREITNTFAALPARAVVIADTDELCFGARYVQLALGQRPDVDIVCFGFIGWDWYQDQLVARGIPIHRRTFTADVEAIALRRPLLYGSREHARLPTYPEGILMRAVPRTAKPPPLAEVVELNRHLFAAFDLDYPRPEPDDDWPALVHRRYAGTWVMLAHDLAAAGDREAARDALAVARELYPYVFQGGE